MLARALAVMVTLEAPHLGVRIHVPRPPRS